MQSTDPRLSRRRHWLALCALGMGALCLPGQAPAQAAFPTRTLTLVVPYAAGGASDIGARMINTEMGKQLGQTVIVDNVGGAAGALGTQKVTRAPAEGYTLLYGSLSDTLLVPMVNPAASYKPTDLNPVAFLGGTPAVFVVRPDFPANTLDEFIVLAKKNPAKYSYGSPGNGSFQHVIGEAFKGRAGVFKPHIPYRGGSQILTDVIGGQIDIGITSAVNAAGFVANGRLKAIGVTSAARIPTMMNAQAFGESDALKGMELSTWGMVFVPAATPDAVQQRIGTAVNTALMTPANVEGRARLGVDLPGVMSPAQAQAFFAAEQAKYAPILKAIKFE